MMKSIFLPLTALCIALAGLQARAGQPPDRFAKADTNHDGKLSLDEVNYYLVVTIFESRDANHDGKMTLQEWVVKGDRSEEKAQSDIAAEALTLKEIGEKAPHPADPMVEGQLKAGAVTH